MKNILLAFFSVISFSLFAQSQYSRVKVDLTERSIKELAELGIETDHGSYARDRHFITDMSDGADMLSFSRKALLLSI